MPITALPTPPSTSSPSNFDTRADAFLGALPTFATEANALQSDVNAKQLLAAQSVLDAADQVALATTQAANAANSATAAFASANVTKWISGTTYTEGSVVWSPTSFYSYRRKTTGAGTTDPASDTTNWSLLTLPALGTGGTSITGSVILTNSSAAAMTVTPTGFGLGATLPDATTCQKGTNLFLITNEGEYDYALYDKSGAKLGFISPKSTVSVGLSDNSTLAGTWVRSNLSRWGILASLRNSTLTNSGNVQQVVQIDSTRSFVLFGGSTLYGVIYDSSLANPFGSVVTIRAVADNNYNRALLTSATQITVISCLTTALEVVTITLTGGVGLTLNSGTKASATLAEMFGEPEHLVGYGRRNVTLNAIAPTTSSAFILGQVSQSIEPIWSNAYVKDVAKLKVTIKNPVLQKLLASMKKDTKATWDSIKKHDGSVQHLDFLTQEQKDVFRTFAEINQSTIINQAAVRQDFIDQAQSLNLMISPDMPTKDVNKLLMDAWQLGVKTLYYQHSMNSAQAFARKKLNLNDLVCTSCEA